MCISEDNQCDPYSYGVDPNYFLNKCPLYYEKSGLETLGDVERDVIF